MNALLWTCVAILIVVLLLLVYIGVFSSIKVKVCKPPFPIGGHYFYKFYQTTYSDVRQAYRAIDKLPLKKSFMRMGIYYDDPEKVLPNMTRYAVGIIMPEENFDEELASTMENVGFQHIQLPQVDSVVATTFPIRSVLSILVAVNRVYPKMMEFIKNERLEAHPCMEYYPVPMSTMHLILPLEKNDLFYVPEFHTTPVDYIDKEYYEKN